MKFGKNLARVVELSDPEWAPFWINYKYLKKKIKDIVKEEGSASREQQRPSDPTTISQSPSEVAFFKLVKGELRKVAEFYRTAEQQFEIRKERVKEGYRQLTQQSEMADSKAWTRLLAACVRFYKELLLLENFAIMNYCGFSKILKKHDKCTGFQTRDAFMTHVVSREEFTHYPTVLRMLQEAERLYEDIQRMQARATPLQDEERLFIEAIRSLNYQASRLQASESQDVREPENGGGEQDRQSGGESDPGTAPRSQAPPSASAALPSLYNKSARLFPHPDAHDVSDDVDTKLDEATTEATAAAIRVSRHFGYQGDTISSTMRLRQLARGEDPNSDDQVPLESAAASISGMMELQSLVAASTSKRPGVDASSDADARLKRTRS